MFKFSLISLSWLTLVLSCGNDSCVFSDYGEDFVSTRLTVGRCRASCLEKVSLN